MTSYNKRICHQHWCESPKHWNVEDRKSGQR